MRRFAAASLAEVLELAELALLGHSELLLAVVQAVLLVLLGWVLLARTATVSIPVLGAGSLEWITWGVAVFLVLNTLGNFSAPHPIERWVMGSVTLVLSGLALIIAFGA
jgi:hypothetical protein